MNDNERPTSRLSKVIIVQTVIQTYRHDRNYTVYQAALRVVNNNAHYLSKLTLVFGCIARFRMADEIYTFQNMWPQCAATADLLSKKKQKNPDKETT